jgi:hypothetical protein
MSNWAFCTVCNSIKSSVSDNNIIKTECPNPTCVLFKQKTPKQSIQPLEINVNNDIAKDLYDLKIAEGERCSKCGKYKVKYQKNLKIFSYCPCSK